MREHKKVTRRERRKKYKKRELFKREMVEVQTRIEKIEESEEPEEVENGKPPENAPEKGIDDLDITADIEKINYDLAMKNQERSATIKILVLEILDDLINEISLREGGPALDNAPLTLNNSKIEEKRGGGDPDMDEAPPPNKKSTATKEQLSKTPSDSKIRPKDSLRNRGGWQEVFS